MKIDCRDLDIRSLLQGNYFLIPRFQRPYSWDKTNIFDFWNDTILTEDSEYFIGSIVVYGVGKNNLGIVDGQQRLTTITIILCVLRNALQNNNFNDLATGIHKLIERPDINNKNLYVLQAETSYPFFQESIQKQGGQSRELPVDDEEKVLKEAFDFFTEEVSGHISSIEEDVVLNESEKIKKIETELQRIRDKILNLKIIFVHLESEDDAYMIFETLNTRGKDLTVADLVKNHILRNLKNTNMKVDRYKDKWTGIVKSFEDSEADLSLGT